MHVRWPDERCILCLKHVPERHQEHLIPKSLGGRLDVDFLCKACNGLLGRQLEARAKEDPGIRLAIERQLSRLAPRLQKQLTDGQEYVGVDGPALRGRLKDGVFSVDTVKGDDGSLIQSGPQARKRVRHLLRKQGHSDDTIRGALEAITTAPPDVPVRLESGLTVIQRAGTKVRPTLDGPLLSHKILLKIAYEFFALHVGKLVYDPAPPLTSIRTAITASDDALLGEFPIDCFGSRTDYPRHALALLPRQPHVVVKIVLFDFLRYRVHFPRIQYHGCRFLYVCPLDGSREALEAIPEGPGEPPSGADSAAVGQAPQGSGALGASGDSQKQR